MGKLIIKAQVPAGKRGKAGAILPADSPEEASAAAESILAMTLSGHSVDRVLVEERAEIAQELYAAVLTDTLARAPAVIFSARGGMDIEALAAEEPQSIRRHVVDIAQGFDEAAALSLLSELDPSAKGAVADVLAKLYALYRKRDCELAEINPLVLTNAGPVLWRSTARW